MTENPIAVVRRGETWVREQEWLDRELARFCRESRPDVLALPADIGRLVIYIHENLFDSALNVNTLKRSCRARNNNVTTRFRRFVGLGIHQYIEALRMEAAGWVLREGCSRIYLVAMAVGYIHLETFCRAFQRRFGYTPSRHRRPEAADEPFAASREEAQPYFEAASL